MSTVVSELNEIEFSFRDEGSMARKTAHNGYNASEIDDTRVQKVAWKSLTSDVVAKVQEIDKEDVGTITKTSELATTVPNDVEEKGLRSKKFIDGRLLDVKQGDHLDETGRYIIRNVPIVKHSTIPLGFFIRQGDGLLRKDGIFVSRIAKESVVEANGLLKVGDEIVAVNHVDVEGFSLDDVVRLIQIPRKLILTIKTNASVFKRSSSVGESYGYITTNNRKTEKGSSREYRPKNKVSRASDYSEASNHSKQTMQIETEAFNVDKNANEFRDFSRSSVRSEGSSTIEDLINAIRAQNTRFQHAKRSVEHSGSFPLDQSQLSKSGEEVRSVKSSQTRQTGRLPRNPGIPTRKPSADSIILSKRTPPTAARRSSTLTPVTTVNLIFDDPDDYNSANPSSQKINAEKDSISEDDSVNVISAIMNSRSLPGSPGGSPKMRRRLPSVPSDGGRSSRSGSERSVGESGNESSASSSPTAANPLLTVPVEPRSRRMLPTPPPSPVAAHKESPSVTEQKVQLSSEKQDSRKSSRKGGSGLSDSESSEDKSPTLSPLRRDSGLSLSQIFNALAFRNHSDTNDLTEKSKDRHGERTESYKIPSSAQQSVLKGETLHEKMFDQQKSSVLPQSRSSGGLQPPSLPRRLASRSSQPNLLVAVQEEQTKPNGKLSLATNSRFSPLSIRRASFASISDKSLTNQLADKDMTDSDLLRSEAEDGFLIFPDDYSGHNLLSSHAVSGMVSLHIIKATNLQFADKKLLEKKKKVFCAVEVDFERKAFTSSKKASKILMWDEMFEVEIQHGREVCLSCFTSSHEYDKPVGKVSFNLSPFVRVGKQHKVLFRMNPQGAIHIEMGFIEMKTLLKRAPSDRKSGVFGFQLNVTSRNENASVPLVVRKCVEEIEKRGLSAQGLYRISGNARRKKQLHAQFDEDSTTVDLSEENYPDINIIAGILKDYLRELPEPLITESLSKLLIRAAQDHVQDQDQASQKRLLSKFLVQLPQNNRETLVYLLNHFMHVIAEKDTNKMDAHNLSVCFGPVLLCPPANLTESKDLLDLKLHIKVVEFLFYLWKNAGMAST